MRSVYAIIGALLIISGSVIAVAVPRVSNNHTIYDVSWPNCQAQLPSSANTAIIGATGGLDFQPNPCLNQEAGQFTHVSLYTNTGYPGIEYGKRFGRLPRHCRATDKLCWAYNYGFSATTYAIDYANSQAVHATFWWLDVETENSWTTSTAQNIASLKGAIEAIRQNVFLGRVGIYSYPAQWQAITGSWQIKLPNWVASGQESLAAIKDYCSIKGFSGGSVWLVQYTPKLDNDYACNSRFLQSLQVH